MESIQHFSHSEHLLILKKLGEKEVDFVCYGCHEPIRENENYYACEEGSGECPSFYLHKKCAGLPREINLPFTHQHPLTLFASSPYKSLSCMCDICQRSDWMWFTYHCSSCGFDMDVICGFILQEEIKNFQHEAHPHPLTFNLKPSLFHCDACDIEAKDSSHFCTTCQFWIHKSCASAPKSITVAHHEDPLLLSYSLPPQHRNFEKKCDICKEKVHPSNWVYYCEDCRYFNHLKCATAPVHKSEIKAKEGDTDFSHLMQFPFPNHDSPDSLSQFVANNITHCAKDENGATEISHRLHQHPLSVHNDAGNVQAYNEILCDGCVRPISVPFYSCSVCNFFLHRFCAELPDQLQCPNNRQHPVKVMIERYCYDSFQCYFCFRECNGFSCECVACDLKLDIGCTSNQILSGIKHDSHGHPLLRRHLPRGGNGNCHACGLFTSCIRLYTCQACSFNLCMKCVNYPGSVRHEYDRHAIPLRYRPIKNHPSDFICEICEEDIDPGFWMYHCQDCNQSFHTHCLSPIDLYSNVKFGGTVNIGDIHQHPLTFVRNSRSEYASLCDQCGRDYNGNPMLECAPCGFKLCISCARKFEA